MSPNAPKGRAAFGEGNKLRMMGEGKDRKTATTGAVAVRLREGNDADRT
jgi:hypothetical protein